MKDLDAPLHGYFVSVTFAGVSPPIDDVAFQAVSGLEPEMETQSPREAGENHFRHDLPKPLRYPNLKLQRAVVPTPSGLLRWCESCLEGGFDESIKPLDLVVRLLGEEGAPQTAWSIGEAFPVRWEAAALDATENQTAIALIELSYQSIERTL